MELLGHLEFWAWRHLSYVTGKKARIRNSTLKKDRSGMSSEICNNFSEPKIDGLSSEKNTEDSQKFAFLEVEF